MQKKSRIICFFCLSILCLTGWTMAQITPTWPTPTPEKTITVSLDTVVDVTSIDFSITGGPQGWTFNQTSPWQEDIELTDPAGTPYAAQFGQAQWVNYLYQYIPPMEVDAPVVGTIALDDTTLEIYNYRRLSNDGWIEELGMGMEYTYMTGSPFVYDTPSQIYPNPLYVSAGDWLEKRVFQPTLTFGAIALNASVTDSTIVSVNGWGDLTLPTGTFPAIQLKRHEYRTITTEEVWPIPSITENIESYSYMWIDDEFDMLLWITSFDTCAVFDTADVVVMTTESSTAVLCDPNCLEGGVLPDAFKLYQNHPNPFNPSTAIRYALPKPAQVSLSVYNILGHAIVELEAGNKGPGVHQVEWDGADNRGIAVAAGIYFYQLRAKPTDGSPVMTETRKLVVAK